MDFKNSILIIFGVFLGACFFSAHGETEVVTTTFGKVFEGNVFEESSRQLRIKTGDGKTYRIKKRYIESRFAQEDISQDQEEEEDGKEHTLDDWKAWKDKNRNYLKESMNVFLEFIWQFEYPPEERLENLRAYEIEELVKAERLKMMRIIKLKEDFERLGSPDQLKRFHAKVQAALNYKIKSQNVWLRNDINLCHRYHIRSVRSIIDGFEEIKRIQIKMGAPGHFFKTIEPRIEKLRHHLNEEYQSK